MSTSRGSGAGNGGGVQLIPAGARKVVQSLKEIVNCPDAEIYAALKDCNMDLNEAVSRLLSQDPFREVKRKREKKKEGRDTYDSRLHGANNNLTRQNRNGADRHLGRGASAPYNASESPTQGKATYKKENGSAPYKSNFSSSGNNRSRVPSGVSDGSCAESKGSVSRAADGMSSVVQTPYQSAWAGVPGQVSMADIVRMGRPQNKSSNAPTASHPNIQDTSAADSFPNLTSHSDHTSKVNQSEVPSFQHVHATDKWPSVEKPDPTNAVEAELHREESGVSDGIDYWYEAEEVQEREDDAVGNSGGNLENDSRGSVLCANELHQNLAPNHSEDPDYEHHEGEGVGELVSSSTHNFEHLSIKEDDTEFPSEGNAPSVVIPDHVQAQAADCSHLSFGSFGSSMSASYSSPTVTSAPVKSNLDERDRNPERDSEADISSNVDTSQSEYYVDDSLGNTHFLRNGPNGATTGPYDASHASQPEDLRPKSVEGARANTNQYPFPSANSGYTLDDAQRLNAAFNETSSQMQNLAPFSNVTPYSNSLPSTLLTGNAHSARESNLQYTPFPVSHSTKYGDSVSSIGGSAISMSEALKTANSSTQPSPGVATAPPLPQHIAVHPYSQPTHPLGPFASMIGYPYLPQSYSYMPSAYQHSFAGNQSIAAALLPQYKSSVSVSSLPQSAAVPSGYGSLGSAIGNYAMNSPPPPSASALNYEDLLSSQYKESSHLLPLHQNESPPMWLHGQGSRTAQAVPSNAYYNYQGQQNQQAGGFRQQVQQQSQNYGASGYPNFYPSQAGISLDQQQNMREAAIGNSQGQPKQSQMWPNGY